MHQEAEGEAVGIDEYDPATGISEAELKDGGEGALNVYLKDILDEFMNEWNE